MSQHDVESERGSRAKAPRAAAGERDERDAAIERLERMLEEERQGAAELRQANDALKFQLQTLERSYAKQLGDARAECARAQQALAAQQAQFSALEAECREAMRLVADARAHFDRVAAEHKLPPRRSPPRGGAAPAFDATTAEGTINQLIADESWARPPSEREAPDSEAPEGAEKPLENEMIPPELVFPAGEEDDKD